MDFTNSYQKVYQIDFKKVSIKDNFWSSYFQKCKDVTLKKALEWCYKTGRIKNFEKAAGLIEGNFEGVVFNDSDVYKIIEGIGYLLSIFPDRELEEKTDEIIDLIEKAQQEDGYINTYFTLNCPDKRWTDMMAHEDYCIGHLIEAAIAYYRATGKRKLLNVAQKAADHLVNVFGNGKKNWIVGHQEIELALVKLYKETNNENYFKLAKWFIEQRGHGYPFYNQVWDREIFGGAAYNQDDKPVRLLSDIKGHAVRAMYYFSGIADIVTIEGDNDYFQTLLRLWDSVVNRNMYITGGIGSSHDNEGFVGDYCLPNKSAYCETCASVGMIFWNYRMHLITGESKYMDVVERVLYNAAIAGLSYKGDKFFYVNPLESDGNHHRQEWYEVSCCPTQIVRFIPTIGEYIYTTTKDKIFINLYISSISKIPIYNDEVIIEQKTNYPWEGKIDIEVDSKIEMPFGINLRVPWWSRDFTLFVNGQMVKNINCVDGYININRVWRNKDKITIIFSMPVEKVYSNPKVSENNDKVALQRGPIIYCIEETDNKNIFDDITVSNETKFAVEYNPELFGGIVLLKGFCKNYSFTAIPYFIWDNREAGKMKVWINEKKDEHLSLYSYYNF